MTTPGWTPPAQVTEAAGLWLPAGTLTDGARPVKALINIVGESGAGKSELLGQLGEDPDYGPDEILVMMHEDATATYGRRVRHIRPVSNVAEVERVLDEIIAAGKKGFRLPKVIGWDSLTGMTDYQQMDFEQNPNMVWSEDKKDYVRDKRSEYGDLGRGAQRVYLKLRDQIPMDVVVLVTSYKGPFNPVPEIACEGKVIPKNLTRWSSCTLYLTSTEGKADVSAIEADIRANGVPKHRTYGRNADGSLDGTFINRFFVTQNTGEIQAKGHHALNIRERAILPDVLRKIHGWKPGDTNAPKA